MYIFIIIYIIYYYISFINTSKLAPISLFSLKGKVNHVTVENRKEAAALGTAIVFCFGARRKGAKYKNPEKKIEKKGGQWIVHLLLGSFYFFMSLIVTCAFLLAMMTLSLGVGGGGGAGGGGGGAGGGGAGRYRWVPLFTIAVK